VKKILVTGSNGALGTAFKDLASSYDYEWLFASSKDADLTVYSEIDWLVYNNAPDYIIHCAALSGGVGISAKHPATLLRDNVWMSINILEAAREHNVEKTIMSLSSGMYGIDKNMTTDVVYPVDEEFIHFAPPHDSNYAYAHAKRLIEPLIRSYREEFGINVIGLVPNGIFGEGDYFGLEDCNMTAALISKFYVARKTTDDIVLWGDGTPLRELTYAKDLARAYMWALEKYDDAQILNVGNTDEVLISSMASHIAEKLDIDQSRITWDTTRPNGPYRKPTDNSKFLKLSNFQYTPFEAAIGKTIRWYHAKMDVNPNLIRTANKVKV